jgi:translation initiation factor 3 subunit G
MSSTNSNNNNNKGLRQRPPRWQGPEFPLRVGNLSSSTTRDDIFNMFRPFGRISRVFVKLDDKTQECLGTATVSFCYEEDADAAQKAMDRSKHGYLILSVERVQSRQA